MSKDTYRTLEKHLSEIFFASSLHLEYVKAREPKPSVSREDLEFNFKNWLDGVDEYAKQVKDAPGKRKAAKAARTGPEVLQIKLELGSFFSSFSPASKDESAVLKKWGGCSKNAISRRMIVPADATLGDIQDDIISAFGFSGFHLSCYMPISEPGPLLWDFLAVDDDMGEEVIDPEASLTDVLNFDGAGAEDAIRLDYDFGDSWSIKITPWRRGSVSSDLREAAERVAASGVPEVVAADGWNAVDDVGGLWGYCEFLERCGPWFKTYFDDKKPGEVPNDGTDEYGGIRATLAWADGMGWRPGETPLDADEG